MKIRWLGFWGSFLVILLAFGAWRNFESQNQSDLRGIEPLQLDMPVKLPLAGVNVQLTQYDDIEAELAKIADLGFHWVRQPFLWSEIEPEQGNFDWSAYDRIMEALAGFDGQLELVAILDGTPRWARHEDAPDHPFAPPASPAAYGEFARALTQRYGDQIQYYQIWDEPNIEGHWGNLNPRPALYLAMLEASYHTIHAEDAEAMVILAALAPNSETGPDNINDPEYLRTLYELGGRDFFDAVAGKPYGFDFSPMDRTLELNQLNFSRLILLREEMVRQGDGDKPLWGSNWGWNSLPPDWDSLPSIWGQVDFQTRQNYTNEAFERASSEWAWLGGLILQHWQPDAPADDPIQGFAIAPQAETWSDIIPQPDNILRTGYYLANHPALKYEGDWTFSELGADAGANAEQNTITFTFEGTELALKVRRGDYLAYLGVTIDGEPANQLPQKRDGEAFVALTAPQRKAAIDLIMLAENLPEGQHTAIITHRPELGDDHFPIVGFAVGNRPHKDSFPSQFTVGIGILAGLSLLINGMRLPWGNIRLPSAHSLRNIADFLLGLFFSNVVMLGTLLTFQDTLTAALRRDLPTIIAALASSTVLYYAPATWIALIGLIITGIIIFSRPWVGVLQIVFWSIFFTTTLDPFFRAVYIVEVMLVVTLAATLARLLYDYAQSKSREMLPHFHPLDACIIGFVILGAFSLLWAEFLPQAIREWRVMLIQPALLYITIRFLRPNRREIAFIAETLMFAGALLSLIGIVAYVTGENIVIAEGGTRRLLSVYGSPNAVALVLGRCLPFSFAYLFLPVSDWRKIFAAITGMLMLLALALTQSVGGILFGFPAGLAIVILGWQGRRAIPILGGLGLAGGVALIPLTFFIPRLRQITDLENNTTLLRVNLWRSTAQMLQDHPFTGVGLDQFLYTYRSRYILPEAWADPDLSHPHNVLLDYWVRLGILGVFLAGLSQYYFWKTASSVYHHAQHDPLISALMLGCMGAMGASLAHGLVDMAHFNINLSYIFALLLVLTVESGKLAHK